MQKKSPQLSKTQEKNEKIMKNFLNPYLKNFEFSEIPKSLLPFNEEVLSSDKDTLDFQKKLYEAYYK